MKKNEVAFLLIILVLIGILDSGYLAYEHYSNVIPPCGTNTFFSDCGQVLKSSYAVVYGIPLALIGLIHYSLLSLAVILALFFNKRIAYFYLVFFSIVGVISSGYFVYLQLFVIKAICLYCMVSAFTSLFVFTLTQLYFSNYRKLLFIKALSKLYQYLLRPILFKINSETIHVIMVNSGEFLGKLIGAKALISSLFKGKHNLKTTIAGLEFKTPVGLAAGFDYEARLTQILPSLGFGFGTIGTITNSAYGGNPKPMLGRLPKSKALLVNKGFKNLGANATADKLKKLKFDFNLGISIGQTNSAAIKNTKTAITDIINSFKKFEAANISNSYYELNISCPNLKTKIDFYYPNNLEQLLKSVAALKITKPVFVKMPIDKSDSDILAMLKVINSHKLAGVIFGNLWKDRSSKLLDSDEVAKYPVGNFSGKPTFERSNELIALTYKNYKGKLAIIGCGGIFSAKDAYTKIKLGANAVQLITGMIFQGPQLISEINFGLEELLQKDGFNSLEQAVGKAI